LETLAQAAGRNPAAMKVNFGPRRSTRSRRAHDGWTRPGRPDAALIRSVYRDQDQK
jgi:hypothetical protein